jgi:hypothetical protein
MNFCEPYPARKSERIKIKKAKRISITRRKKRPRILGGLTLKDRHVKFKILHCTPVTNLIKKNLKLSRHFLRHTELLFYGKLLLKFFMIF